MLAKGNPLLGTWKLKSYVVNTAAGTKLNPYGLHPMGYLGYSVDGRMHVIGIADGRLAAHETAQTDQQQLTLYKTMFAYAGRYSIEDGRVIHHVDIAWNESWTGTDQVRFFEVNGNTLTLTTDFANPADGTKDQYVVVWEKV